MTRARRWAQAFRQTKSGEMCTEKSLNILREAEAQGFVLGVDQDKTFTATQIGIGTSYLRSNGDIERFGQFIEIMSPDSTGR